MCALPSIPAPIEHWASPERPRSHAIRTTVAVSYADEDQHVRNAACRALPFARLGATWVAQHQTTLVKARIKNDALQQAIDALAMLEPTMLARHMDAIRRHATDKHECVRDAVARAIAKVADWRMSVDLPPVDAASSLQPQVS